jgi:hypothetical protein
VTNDRKRITKNQPTTTTKSKHVKIPYASSSTTGQKMLVQGNNKNLSNSVPYQLKTAQSGLKQQSFYPLSQHYKELPLNLSKSVSPRNREKRHKITVREG